MAGITGVYFGLDKERLVGMRDDVLAQLDMARRGKRFASVSGNGKGFSKDNMSLRELQADLAEIGAALQRANPEEFGVRRVTRIVPDFRRAGLA